ncbi:hypothetical protein BDV98DRAFT_603797 [Pterulicium gracile]|uniref:DRBM domain-containing protein n=1 Tax=Pterulicium gracile TaxID=1884261 RepID=A0A5C3QKS6_9AGAR|nr:hypothetical protein BDV98DRAFT_603797 [Pterula gracilis]
MSEQTHNRMHLNNLLQEMYPHREPSPEYRAKGPQRDDNGKIFWEIYVFIETVPYGAGHGRTKDIARERAAGATIGLLLGNGGMN